MRVLNSEIYKEEMDPDALGLVLGATEMENGDWAMPDDNPRWTITDAGRALMAGTD